MQVTLDIPDAVAERLVAKGHDIAREALQAFAIEGYRNKELSEYQIQLLLGFDTRMQVHEVMKKHDVYWHYSAEDFDNDTRTLQQWHEARRKAAA